MRLERKRNTIRNTGWGLINRVVALLGPFIVRTLIIYLLGIEYLGLNSLFTSILQVLNMADLGFGSAIAYGMYEPVAKDDSATICALLSLFRKVYKLAGLVILGCGLALLPFLDRFINSGVPKDINIHFLYLLYLGNASISYLICAYRSVLFSAFQREDVISKVSSVLLLMEYAGQIVILILFRNYYLYYVIVPVINIFNNLVIDRLSKKRFSEYYPYGAVSDEKKADIKEKVSGIVISKLCGLSRNAFDSIIISALIGLNAVAIYSNYYYILSNLSSVLVIGITSMKAGIGNSIAMDSQEKNHKDFFNFSFLYMWIAGWCTICLLCLYQPFMELWVHKENMFPFYMVVLLSIYFFGLCMGDIIDVYSGASGLWWENRKRTVCEAACNLFLNIVLGYYFGTAGIVSATIITIILCNFFWKVTILYENYFISYKVTDYIKTYIRYIMILAGIAFITLWVCKSFNQGSLADLVVRGMICLILPNLLFCKVYREDPQYKKAKILVKDIVIKIIRKEK